MLDFKLMTEGVKEAEGSRLYRLLKRISSLTDRESTRIKSLEIWINSGLDLIKQGRYQEAISYFEDDQKARGADLGGVSVYDMALNPDESNEYSEGRLLDITDMCAARSHLSHSGDIWTSKSRSEPARLNLARIFMFKEGKELTLPNSVYHNVSLIHAEEWLHGVQFLRGQPLAGLKDPEIDVAVYLQSKDVPLTDKFLARYNRAKSLINPS